MTEQKKTITSMLDEKRQFVPPAEFSKKAHVKSMKEYEALAKRAEEDLEGFWADQAHEYVHWFKEWDTVLEWNPPFAKWFKGGKTNISYNCLDKHLEDGRADKTAIIWEGEPEGDNRKVHLQGASQGSLQVRERPEETRNKEGRQGHPVHADDPGARDSDARLHEDRRHTFDSVRRIQRELDHGPQRGRKVETRRHLRRFVQEREEHPPEAQRRRGSERFSHGPEGDRVQENRHEVEMVPGRDVWWHDEMAGASADCPCEEMDAEDVAFILYTSGTTGKPKGVVHSTGGYLVYTAMTSKLVFDIKDEDVFWCTADIGWITGHSYIVYGPLNLGATTLMFEGVPSYPNPDRFWEIIAKYKVNIFYTAPTAIRAIARTGDEWVKKHDLTSLRLLGTVGEPINPEAWMWYYNVIGGGRCPIVDTWWQTETGGILITPLPGAFPIKPGSATKPFPGIFPKVVREDGTPADTNEGGYLTIQKPWPAMLRTIWGDDQRFKDTYFTRFKDVYFTGDGAREDEDGYFWIMGRVDDVINVSGHRIGTMEVESALVSHPKVAEAAVVPMPHEIKGQGLYAFVTLQEGVEKTEELKQILRNHVSEEIGPIAKPDVIHFADALPKTRSGKIMRRILKSIASGSDEVGDTTTLADPKVVEHLLEERKK